MALSDAAAIKFSPVTASDFEALLSLRILVMRESLERIGRFDATRARERFASAFQPQYTRRILINEEFVGCVAMKPAVNGLLLEHFYLSPPYQGRGLGGGVLRLLLAEAGAAQEAIHLSVLRESDAARFYERYGFVKTGEDEWDIYYRWTPDRSSIS